jgi:NAD(P)-dependent dehydrogenase (short-subunit alcohol dehydrogenase family)
LHSTGDEDHHAVTLHAIESIRNQHRLPRFGNKEILLKRIPLGRPATLEEVARAVRFLIVDGEYLTGTTLDLNGGWLMA